MAAVIPGVLAGGESALQIIIIIVYTTYSSYYLTASQSSRVPNKPPAYTQAPRTASGPLYPSGSYCVTVYSSQQSADSKGTQIIFVVAINLKYIIMLIIMYS